MSTQDMHKQVGATLETGALDLQTQARETYESGREAAARQVERSWLGSRFRGLAMAAVAGIALSVAACDASKSNVSSQNVDKPDNTSEPNTLEGFENCAPFRKCAVVGTLGENGTNGFELHYEVPEGQTFEVKTTVLNTGGVEMPELGGTYTLGPNNYRERFDNDEVGTVILQVTADNQQYSPITFDVTRFTNPELVADSQE